MMRWILLFCMATICLDVPEIDAMKCFWPGKSKKHDNNNKRANAKDSQSNTSSSRPTPASGLQPFQGHLRPPITSGVHPSARDSQPFARRPQLTVPSSSRPSTSGSDLQPSSRKASHIMKAPLCNTGSQKFTPNPKVVKRLTEELRDFVKNPSENCSAGLKNEDDLFEWIATINGPEDSPYEGGVFELSLSMPVNYPSRPPKVKFLTKVYHCNIDLITGEICVDILKGKWRSNMTISSILLFISTLLINPNPESPLEYDIAETFKNNIDEYYENAQRWTKKYAKPHQ